MAGIANKDVHRRAEIERELTSRVDHSIEMVATHERCIPRGVDRVKVRAR